MTDPRFKLTCIVKGTNRKKHNSQEWYVSITCLIVVVIVVIVVVVVVAYDFLKQTAFIPRPDIQDIFLWPMLYFISAVHTNVFLSLSSLCLFLFCTGSYEASALPSTHASLSSSTVGRASTLIVCCISCTLWTKNRTSSPSVEGLG